MQLSLDAVIAFIHVLRFVSCWWWIAGAVGEFGVMSNATLSGCSYCMCFTKSIHVLQFLSCWWWIAGAVGEFGHVKVHKIMLNDIASKFNLYALLTNQPLDQISKAKLQGSSTPIFDTQSDLQKAKTQRKYYTNVLAKLRKNPLKPKSTFQPLSREYDPSKFIEHHPDIELRRLTDKEYSKQFYHLEDDYEDNYEDKDNDSTKQATMSDLVKATKSLSICEVLCDQNGIPYIHLTMTQIAEAHTNPNLPKSSATNMKIMAACEKASTQNAAKLVWGPNPSVPINGFTLSKLDRHTTKIRGVDRIFDVVRVYGRVVNQVDANEYKLGIGGPRGKYIFCGGSICYYDRGNWYVVCQ